MITAKDFSSVGAKQAPAKPKLASAPAAPGELISALAPTTDDAAEIARLHECLQRNEEFNQALLSTVADPIFEVRKDGLILALHVPKDNEFGYHWLPKRAKADAYSHQHIFVDMYNGTVKGFLALGQNPAVGGPNAKLARNHRVVCGSPAYFKRAGKPRTLAELPKHNCLVTSTEDGVAMAIEHKTLPVAGVQFHPESLMSLGGEVGLRIVENAFRLDAGAY